ncbi:MAG TPA: hypothetical protein VGC91_00090 [Pyrinomonadaceae bacterium]
MKRITLNLFIALAILAAAMASAEAQGRKKKTVRAPESSAVVVVSEADAPDAAPQKKVEIVKAAEVYKTSLRQLLAARKAEAAQTAEQLEKLKELYKDGLVSKRQLEESDRKLLEAQHKVEETRAQLAATDSLVVESLAATDASQVADYDAPAQSRKTLKKVAYIRYKGYADWSIADVGKIEKFFQAKFKRPLPVAALGQSDTHTRLGFDHRNAVDVSLSPDSAEGLALMDYLSSQGIPFMAFRRAVPGSATGPHIHIGKPSLKNEKLKM